MLSCSVDLCSGSACYILKTDLPQAAWGQGSEGSLTLEQHITCNIQAVQHWQKMMTMTKRWDTNWECMHCAAERGREREREREQKNNVQFWIPTHSDLKWKKVEETIQIRNYEKLTQSQSWDVLSFSLERAAGGAIHGAIFKACPRRVTWGRHSSTVCSGRMCKACAGSIDADSLIWRTLGDDDTTQHHNIQQLTVIQLPKKSNSTAGFKGQDGQRRSKKIQLMVRYGALFLRCVQYLCFLRVSYLQDKEA